jgi:hypothetical protein
MKFSPTSRIQRGIYQYRGNVGRGWDKTKETISGYLGNPERRGCTESPTSRDGVTGFRLYEGVR